MTCSGMLHKFSVDWSYLLTNLSLHPHCQVGMSNAAQREICFKDLLRYVVLFGVMTCALARHLSYTVKAQPNTQAAQHT